MSGPDFKVHDPKGWCGDPRRGAAMGRGSWHLDDKDAFDGKLYLRYMPLVDGDYDKNGTYWGGPGPLYWCANEDQTIDFVIRARNREDAKAQVKALYPKARFYN